MLRSAAVRLAMLLPLAAFAARAFAQNAVDGFDPNIRPSLYVEDIAIQTDGKIVIGGDFWMVGGQSRTNIVRLNPDGSLDTTFNPSMDNDGRGAHAVTLQPDGKILVGGRFTTVGGQARTNIARLNSNGSLDTSFNPGAGAVFDGVNAVTLQADGKILVGGTFRTLGGQSRTNLGRLNGDGSLDTTFNPGARGEGFAFGAVLVLAVQADGKILVGGDFTTLGGQPRNRIGRLNADGSLDTTFNPGANRTVYSLAVQADGKILFGRNFSLARLHADGTADTTFNPASAGSTPTAVWTPRSIQGRTRA